LFDNFDVILWAIVTALMFAGELLTVSFFLLFFAFGAAVSLVMALTDIGGLTAQIIGFIVASILSMVILRPALLNRLALAGSEPYEGPGKIEGRKAVVTDPIEPGESGMVKIGNGEFWTARTLYTGGRIESGVRVQVLDTDGLTALVEPLDVEEGEQLWKP
jgi:membrane protein implicated in regulation of membrane protease activity